MLLLGQDPGQHENVLRRILSGEAGRRVQGFLAKLGITRSYVNLNTFLYSCYGTAQEKYVAQAPIANYRAQWIDGILALGKIQAVVAFGLLAQNAWATYVASHAAAAALTSASR